MRNIVIIFSSVMVFAASVFCGCATSLDERAVARGTGVSFLTLGETPEELLTGLGLYLWGSEKDRDEKRNDALVRYKDGKPYLPNYGSVWLNDDPYDFRTIRIGDYE